MKKAISVIRIAALAAMGCAGAVLVFGEELDKELLPYVLHFILDKALGLGLIAAAVMLAARWSRTDGALKALAEWCGGDDE